MIPPTKSEPFRLVGEERVENRLNKWQEDINKVKNSLLLFCRGAYTVPIAPPQGVVFVYIDKQGRI